MNARRSVIRDLRGGVFPLARLNECLRRNPAFRAAKRWKREHRPSKRGTWRCSNCGERHPIASRCPIPIKGKV